MGIADVVAEGDGHTARWLVADRTNKVQFMAQTTHAVVRKIRQILDIGDAPSGVDGEQVAATYAALSADAVQRLEICVTLIDGKQIPSAVQKALESPNLLDLCTHLDFPELKQWIVFCRAQKWPLPQVPAVRDVRRLINAFETSRGLAPLEREFRAAVTSAGKKRDFRKATRILRQLSRAEPGNADWKQQQRLFEQERARELDEAVQSAEAGDDLEALLELKDELNEEWLAPPAADLRVSTDAAIGKIRTKRAMEAGAEICQRLDNAYGGGIFGDVGRFLAAYDRLIAGGFFAPTDDMQSIYEGAGKWHAERAAEQKLDQEVLDLERKIWAAVAKDPPDEIVHELWAKRRIIDRPVDPRLEGEVHEAEELLHEIKTRQDRIRIVLISTIATFVLLVAGGILAGRHYLRLHRYYDQEMQVAAKNLDPAQFSSVLVDMRKEPVFARFLEQSEEIQEHITGLQQLERTVEAHEQRFTRAVDEMTRIARGKYEDDDLFQSLMEDAERTRVMVPCLRSDPQNEARLTAVKTARKLHWQKVMTDYASQLNAFAEDLNSRTPTVEDIRTRPLDELETALVHLASQLDDAKGITAPLRAAAGRIGMVGAGQAALSRLDAVSREIRDRLEAVVARKRALANLPTVTALSAYIDGLQAYVARFPGDTRSEKMKVVLEANDVYSSFLAGAHGRTHSPPTLHHLGQIFRALPADNRFWKKVYGYHTGYHERLETEWQTTLDTLRQWKDDRTLTDLHEFYLMSGDQKILALCWKDFTSDANKRGVSGNWSYTGSCYAPSPDDVRPQFRVPATPIPEQRMRGFRATGHVKLIKEMAEECAGVEQDKAVEFLVRWTERTANNTEFINDLLRLRVLRFLAKKLQAILEVGTYPSLDEGIAALDAIQDQGLEWMCVANQAVLDTAAKAGAAITDDFPHDLREATASRFLRIISQICVERGVQWVGFANPLTPKGVSFRQTAAPREIWVLRTNPDNGKLEPYVAGELVGGKYRFADPPLPWEPLFGPENTAAPTSASELRRAIKEAPAAQRAKLDQVEWPACWPVNRRS
jgi:hypothetical protein